MIAKGLDFPNVTLVGVVNADIALHLPDFRASERTFQLVAQVAGRTGRGDRLGRVLVQTYSPDHPAIRCAVEHDYEGFARGELPEREKYGVPPYGRLVRLIARGRQESAVQAYLDNLAAAFRQAADPSVRLLGPPRPHSQDPRSLPVPPPVTLSQFPPTSDVMQRRSFRASTAAWHRAGHRRRPDDHAVIDDRCRAPVSEKNQQFGQNSLKFDLQERRLAVSSGPFVQIQDSRGVSELMVGFRPHIRQGG